MLTQLTATLRVDAYLMFWLTVLCIALMPILALRIGSAEGKRQTFLWRLTRKEVLPGSQGRKLDYMPLAPPGAA